MLDQRAVAPARDALRETLARVFGHAEFRRHQEAVCREVVAGRDALLVMPTGAGKSLCYQLPGLVRGGVTLVVSPLIALMEDQVGKLQELGLRAERIHSGRDRSASREVCRRYLAGDLDYLFVAPERLRVPGFVPMLAKRTPGLVAIDEAHCISQWGHDFRPDYRLLAESIAGLRPAPVIALTATATPHVQDDIAAQLGLIEPQLSIHGFRRTNLAIEVIERAPSERAAIIAEVLAEPARRPAIVYAATRKVAEELAEELAEHFPSAAYHAGLDAGRRDDLQRAFLAGDLEVMVATVAFGMGIDKANVRTVIHAALPGSLEGYYQEIGRAGRDGLPSRAILLQSFVDEHTHGFFVDRDYPAVDVVRAIYKEVAKGPVTLEALAQKSRLGTAEVIEKAVDKLWLHGGVKANDDDTLEATEVEWAKPYEAQRKHRRDQMGHVRRYVEAPRCRMIQLVRYFGDDEDEPCGQCDVCAPEACVGQKHREAGPEEIQAAERIVSLLQQSSSLATGQLHRRYQELGGPMDRRSFEHVLGGLVRGGKVRVEEATFTNKEGERVTFQRARLVDGATLEVGAFSVVRSGRAQPPKKRAKKAPAAPRSAPSAADREAAPHVIEALKRWRKLEAQRHGLPAFRILTDKVIEGIATLDPASEVELLQVKGLGLALVRKHGEALLAVLRDVR